MILEQMANIAEILGIVIVIVSLIYPNVQVKQNSVMLRSTATEGVTDHLVEMYDSLISSENMAETDQVRHQALTPVPIQVEIK